jgi:hypothetical protein
VWSCPEPVEHSSHGEHVKTCSQVFPQRHLLSAHLQRAHDVAEPDELERKMDLALRGISRFDPWFWCGFCQDMIPAQDDHNTFIERFSHIDDHFFGHKGLPRKGIEDWRDCPPRLLVEQGAPPPPQQQQQAVVALAGKKRGLSPGADGMGDDGMYSESVKADGGGGGAVREFKRRKA